MDGDALVSRVLSCSDHCSGQTEVEMQDSKCRWRNAARNEGDTRSETKVVLQRSVPSVTESCRNE